MRYLDWDVLLFPVEEQGTQVPMKEFKTACYAEQYDNAPNVTPLLTTFIPALQKGKPFQISLHSWSETGPMLTVSSTIANTNPPQEIWQVRVVIDGVCESTERFPIDSHWPQVISTTSSSETGQRSSQLRFPPFHRPMMTQTYWEPADPLGRIRVEISTGYIDLKENRFFRIFNIVNFAFQVAPMDLLESSGIAWPNAHIMGNPLRVSPYSSTQLTNDNVGFAATHKTPVSTGRKLPAPLGGMPTPAASSPFNPIAQDGNNGYNSSSRSSSAYSTVPIPAAPLLQKLAPISALYGGLPDATHRTHPVSLRLPSDQLRLILNAINPSTQGAPSGNTAATMPPPPPPGSMLPKDRTISTVASMPALQGTRAPLGADIAKPTSRRAESSLYSDVSMHPGCTDFPLCTSEDDAGQIVHNPLAAPAAVVRGRKEGSSPTKRKLSVSSASVDTRTEKKTRRSARLLQHDPGHDGTSNEQSGNDNDAGQGGDNNAGDGGDAALV